MSKYKKLFHINDIMICRCTECEPLMCQVIDVKKDTYCSLMTCQKIPTTTVSPIITTTMNSGNEHSYSIVLSLTVLTIIVLIIIIVLRKRHSLITNAGDDFENMNLMNGTIELVDIHF